MNTDMMEGRKEGKEGGREGGKKEIGKEKGRKDVGDVGVPLRSYLLDKEPISQVCKC